MQKNGYILVVSILFIIACKSSKGIKQKPAWVQNRPTTDIYYIGIGIASKTTNPSEFQQIAKKNAASDLISEIKVTVSSNSVLSQFQNNKEFSQQFESDVKITALNTIDEFNVVDSWEDKDFFWIYYRLNKEEYKAAQRRKVNAAIEQAENYYTLSQNLTKLEFMQSFRYKIKALAVLQPYLNEDLQTTYKGKNIYLVSELVNSIQQQLYEVELTTKTTQLNGKLGKPILNPFEVKAQYRNDQLGIPFMPITLFSEQGNIEATLGTETNQTGIASLSIAKIIAKAPLQTIRIVPDLKSMIKVDSINQTLKNILLVLDVPSAAIRLNVEATKVFIESVERNLSKNMQTNYLESTLKKKLVDDGCVFVKTKIDADYIISIKSDTRADGNIWGNMKSAALNMTLSVVDIDKNVEIYKDALHEIKGFQTTDENAGLDAYKKANEQLLSKIYPLLKTELMQGK